MEPEREYVVSLHEGVNYDQFWLEMETTYPSPDTIPNRAVDIVNERPGSLRSCHYALSDSEAALLRQDARVKCVEIPPDQRSDIQIRPRLVQTGNWDKTTQSTGTHLNYGLIRCNNLVNPYGVLNTTDSNYDYNLDGTGVDVVIQDSGVEPNHPEFWDASETSRLQQINWYTESGLPGTQSVNFYRDYDGHGTHVAGIATGRTYGWAKNARIYSMKVRGLEGSGDSNTGIVVTDCMDVIKMWHLNKPITQTGYRRPTVVNMSWGYSASFTNITGGNYRGTPWSGVTRRTDYGMIGSLFNGTYYFDVRTGSVDTDVEELIQAGVIVVIAAGNSYQKVDVSGGLDYNNVFTSSLFGNIEYHQGGSPFHADAIKVGSLDSVVFDELTEQKSTFSNAGPGVDVWAPGSNIRSACSTINSFGASNYYLNSEFKQVNLSGTSMAAPQITGLLALMLQANPHATPSQVNTWIANNSQDQVYTTNLDNDYTNSRSKLGASSGLLINPFKTSKSVQLKSCAWSNIRTQSA